jgi:hypothetical protein
MLHKLLVSTAAGLFVFALLVGVLRPLVWHPFKLLTDADYARQHQERGLTTWRDGSFRRLADVETRARLEELRELRRELVDAGADAGMLGAIDAREQALLRRLGPSGSASPEPGEADPVGANARWFLLSVAAAALASVLLAIDGMIG